MPSNNKSGLDPKRYTNLDFFVCDIIDAQPKDDLGSMEHPIFSLSTRKKDLKPKNYSHNGISISIVPSVLGCATILDKDIIIYALSQLTEFLNQGGVVQKKVRITAYDYFYNTNRATDGREYERLTEGLKRLKGTNIHTNMLVGDKIIEQGFGLIEDYRIIAKITHIGKKILESIEITLSEWLFNAVKRNQVLTITKDYFRLSKPLERRMYELARKHCGRQAQWRVSMKVLHKKSGSVSSLVKFRQNMKEVVNRNCIPDYCFLYEQENDLMIVFTRDTKKLTKAKLKDEQIESA